jgi:hypothetical protein
MSSEIKKRAPEPDRFAMHWLLKELDEVMAFLGTSAPPD